MGGKRGERGFAVGGGKGAKHCKELMLDNFGLFFFAGSVVVEGAGFAVGVMTVNAKAASAKGAPAARTSEMNAVVVVGLSWLEAMRALEDEGLEDKSGGARFDCGAEGVAEDAGENNGVLGREGFKRDNGGACRAGEAPRLGQDGGGFPQRVLTEEVGAVDAVGVAAATSEGDGLVGV